METKREQPKDLIWVTRSYPLWVSSRSLISRSPSSHRSQLGRARLAIHFRQKGHAPAHASWRFHISSYYITSSHLGWAYRNIPGRQWCRTMFATYPILKRQYWAFWCCIRQWYDDWLIALFTSFFFRKYYIWYNICCSAHRMTLILLVYRL